MTMTIEIGWWLLPVIVTTVCYAWSLWVAYDISTNSTGFLGAFIDGPIIAAFLGGATIISLIAWCIYFALT